MNMEDEDAVDKPQDWIVCGRLIGTATGWDLGDIFDMIIYNWEPAEPLREIFGAGPIDGASIHFEYGTITVDNGIDADPPRIQVDLVEALAKCEKRDINAPR